MFLFLLSVLVMLERLTQPMQKIHKIKAAPPFQMSNNRTGENTAPAACG